MIISAQLSWWTYFSILEKLLTTYNTELNGISLEDTYRSPYIESGGFGVSNGPMEVSFETADSGCLKAQSSLFTVSEDMNLSELFTKAHLHSTWTGITTRSDKKVFVDMYDRLPITRTKFDTIDDSQLVAGTFDSDTHGVILKNMDTTGAAFRFAYVPVLLTSTYRAVCLKTLPFPRVQENLKMIKYFKQEFHKDIDAELRSLGLSYVSANNSLAALPIVPADLDLTDVREAKIYDTKVQEEIDNLEAQIPEIVKGFREIETAEDVGTIWLMHDNWIKQVNRIESKLTNPITNPLILIDNRWQTDIKSNSRVQVFKKNDAENTVILKLEVPSVNFAIPNKQWVPLPVFDGSEGVDDEDSVTVPSRSHSPLPSSTVATTSTTTTTTTMSPTPYTITTSKPFTTTTASTTAKPIDEGWGDWFTRTWAKVKSFTEFLNMSLRLPSAYDIICLIMIAIHSLILTFILFFRRARRVVVRKMDWKAAMPNFRRRHSDTSIITPRSNTRPSAPTIIEMRDVQRKNRQIQWEESSEEESKPFRPRSRVRQIETNPRSAKRPAPPPPYPLYPSVSGTNRKKEARVYLPKSLPLYLVESDVE